MEQDPAHWPLHFTDVEKSRYCEKDLTFFQNKNSDFNSSVRKYKDQNRFFNTKHFTRTLNNGEKCERKWLLYSQSTGSVYCYTCKLFGVDHDNSFVTGFSNWKKINLISAHENSSEHKQNMLTWIERMRVAEGIDVHLMTVMESEIKYWTEILKSVVAVIKFIAERGLAFRGTHEVIGSQNNGNYLGILELISDFDTFLKEHITLYANKCRGTVSYLSKTICEELITIMSETVKKQIINGIKQAKYWGLVVDSTPDIAHTDQLSVIFRYYYNGNVFERLFCFLSITSHTGESLSVVIFQLLEDIKINISNCRAQTYDNASNMSRKYSGL